MNDGEESRSFVSRLALQRPFGVQRFSPLEQHSFSSEPVRVFDLAQTIVLFLIYFDVQVRHLCYNLVN